MLYLVTCNYLNQIPNINKTVQAFKQLEFIVTHEQFMTATAKFADIVLPASMRLERNDLCTGNGVVPSYGYLKKIVEPLDEVKSHFEICIGLSRRLGINDFADKTEMEYIQQMLVGSAIPDVQAFSEEAIYPLPFDGPYVAFQPQIKGPKNNPFLTPSGKIEIYSQEIAKISNPEIPPIPKYIEPWEGPSDPLRQKYPLQLVTTHTIRRAHSQYELVPWLKELEAQAIDINTADAEARGIKNGDVVKVFNDRGETRLPARVTETIMPGVVDIPQGSWYDPDENGIDQAGSCNVLTKDAVSPIGAFPSNTCLVEVAKV